MKFDTDLSKSPVYVDEAMLSSRGACQHGLGSFCEIFGEDAKIPVTRRNWKLANELDLSTDWLLQKFLGETKYEAFLDEWWPSQRTFDQVSWKYIRRELKARYPEFYAAQKARS